MNKAELARSLCHKLNMSKAEAEKCVSTVFETITESLSKHENVAITGFGLFEVTTRQARTGRNPKTGEPVNIPETHTVKFKARNLLKKSV